MSSINIVFLDRTGIPASHTIPRPSFPHTWTEYDRTSPEQVLARAREAEIIITSKVVLSREILAKLPKLKLIAVTATGTNNIDLVAADEFGIVVKNVTGYSNVSVPEHVLGMIYALKHRLIAYHHDQLLTDKWANCGQFCYVEQPIQDIQGSTLGIIGKGNIGEAVAKLAQAVGMRVIFAERQGASEIRSGYVAFEQVLKQADILSLHCPLTPETEKLINAKVLSKMKPTAYLINTGRGGLIDETALLHALQTGKLAGAGLDVLTEEPPKPDNALMQAAKCLPNLLITPHIAWASDSALTTLCAKVTENIETFVKWNG